MAQQENPKADFWQVKCIDLVNAVMVETEKTPAPVGIFSAKNSLAWSQDVYLSWWYVHLWLVNVNR